MGNGHPIAALVARPEVMDKFAQTHRYFNTFGGNTVACEVGLAVLDVIEQERLMENAHQMGELLQQGLRSLASTHSVLGEVRGAGLFIGVQVESREATARIVNGLRRAGVLIGSAGRNVDVLKIRPPLTIARVEVEVLLEQLEKVLRTEARPPTGRR